MCVGQLLSEIIVCARTIPRIGRFQDTRLPGSCKRSLLWVTGRNVRRPSGKPAIILLVDQSPPSISQRSFKYFNVRSRRQFPIEFTLNPASTSQPNLGCTGWISEKHFDRGCESIKIAVRDQHSPLTDYF